MSSRVTRVFGLGLVCALGMAVGCGRSELAAELGPQVAGCAAGLLHCAGVCVDADDDARNCGGCGRTCPGQQSCRAGRCEPPACADGLRACNGVCFDLRSDATHCGGCGIACGRGVPCRDGRCDESQACLPPATVCGDSCVSLSTDANHCGACFNACAGSSICDAGICVPGCTSGLDACADDCVDLAFDPQHCGACEVVCESNQVCNQGRCEDRSCEAGLVACGGECVDLQWDSNHCGECFTPCPGGASCASGVCRCPELRTLCGDECVFLNADSEHCGECGHECTSDETCEGGECVSTCGDSLVLCGDACVNVATDVNHCGACDTECTSGDHCVDGACRAACDWDIDLFPIEVDIDGTSVGDLTLDDDCNLYVGKQPGAVHRVDAQTHEIELLTEVETYVRGIVFRPEDGLLYFSTQDRVHRMATDGSDLVELENTNIGQHLNGMTIAPAGWGEFGGYLMLVRSDGLVIAINPDEPLPTVIATMTPFISDLEFDGQTLYVAAYTERRIVRVDPDGQVTAFADVPCNPDGLTVAPGSHLFVACGDANELYSYSLADGTGTLVGEAALNGLWAPSGLLWDGTDTLIVLEETLLDDVVQPDGSVLRAYDPL